MKTVINILFYIIASAPQWMVLLFAKSIGLTLNLTLFRKKIIKKNLDLVFPNEKDHRKRINDIYHHFGLLVTELIQLSRPKKFKQLEKISGKETLFASIGEALLQQKGLCILAGHIGNWEVGGALLASKELGVRNQTIVKEMRSEIGNHILYKIREPNGVQTILRKDNAVRKVLKALKNNEIVTFVLDQSVKRADGVFADFFGKPASTMPNLATVVRRTGSPVLPVAVLRNKDLRSFRVELLDPLTYIKKEDPKEEIQANCANYNKVLEQLIMIEPEQWIWMHNRWRSKPSKKELGIRN